MKKIDYETGSGNVFADLGLPNPEERLAKARLAIQINLLIKGKKLTQKEAARLLEIDQPKISALHRGKLAGFSLERLFRFLNILGQEIDIKVRRKSSARKERNISVSLPKIKRKPKVISNNEPTVHAPMLARKKR
jgi:predicted XRE-type DNA-binding protein